MAEHRLGKILSLCSAITSGSFWTYIKNYFMRNLWKKYLPLETLDYKNIWLIFVQKIRKVFKYLFKNKNSELLMTTKFRPMSRRKLAGPTKIVLFMHFRLLVWRNYISSNDRTKIPYFRPSGRWNLAGQMKGA